MKRVDGPPFALWGWGDAVESYGHDRWYFAVREGDEIVGAVPLFHIESRLFGSKLVSPPFAERGSLLLSDTSRDAVADLLLERTRDLADDLGVDFVSLRGARGSPGRQFTRNNRFVTFQVPLTRGPDSVWEGVKPSRQRQIRQARDESLTYRAGTSLEDLKEYYQLYLASMRGHGSPPHSFEFFRILREQLGESGQLRLGMVEKDGSLINGIIDLSLGSRVYQWGVVTDYEQRDLNGGSLALWNSLQWAAESGYSTYEFGRTREGSGVYMFKKSFGGDKVWYDDWHYFPGDTVPLPHPGKDRYEPAKRVWRRLPIAVTRAVGPMIRKSISL